MRRRGWRQNALGRCLGLANPRNVWRKGDGREWIYRSEQIRMSHVLKRIISGELVQVEGGKRGRPDLNGRVANAVLADHPTPLVQRPEIKYHLLAGRLRVTPREPPIPALPTFRQMFEHTKVRPVK